ncbi:MAG: ribose-phosphate pyrophosphokinase [Bacteroidales bacterium]|nr:ribose-phosphate pyrophosphokinase [Bacteroidales bacterium]
MHDQHRMEIFACKNSEPLALKIAEHLGMKLGESSLLKFSDGEFQPAYDESVRGATVYIVQSTNPPVENLFELLLMIDAAKRASAHKVIAVMPYFGWARQDRKDRPRVPIGAKLVANLLTAAGCDRVMTCDLHADQIQGFFDIPLDHVFGANVFIPYVKRLRLPNLSIAAPDMGGAKRANKYAKELACPMIICHKSRAKANVVESITAIGEVQGRDIVIIDDMIDTAGTLCKAAEVLIQMGANSVRACATHGILSGEAVNRIEASALKEVIVSDTIPSVIEKAQASSKITVVSITKLFAEVVDSVYNYGSIGEIFKKFD